MDIHALNDALDKGPLLQASGNLYVTARTEGELPEVWSDRGDFIARFLHRADAEAIVAVVNSLRSLKAVQDDK